MHRGGNIVEFGPFALDLSAECLHCDGSELPMRRQAFRALKTLVVHSGRYLDHDQLMREAWEGTSVSRHTVTVTVCEVRRILGEYGDWIRYQPSLGYRFEVPEADELLRTGWHLLNRRTRDGLEMAVGYFERAAQQTGAEARAMEGLSRTRLLLSSYGIASPVENYPRFVAAHRRAVELRGMTPPLRVDFALGLHVFERRFAASEVQFQRAIEEQPSLGEASARLAMLYVAWKREDEAIGLLNGARTGDSLALTRALAEILIHFCRHDFEKAADFGFRILKLHPFLQTVLTFHANALEHCGRFEEALCQYRKANLLSPGIPWHHALEAACLARMGRIEEAEDILVKLREMQKTQYLDGYHLAIAYDAMGRRDEAFQELARAEREGATVLAMLAVDPKMDPLRNDPRFWALEERLFRNRDSLEVADETPQAQIQHSENGGSRLEEHSSRH